MYWKKAAIILLICILCGCGKSAEEEIEKETETGTEIETEGRNAEFFAIEEAAKLSNSTLSWGMKRNPPESPEFTQQQIELMDKYGCIYKGAEEKKYLYLTFDEGYENGMSGKILDVLGEKGVKAAFFITGDYFKREKELVDRMVNEGHTVGNHTMNHPSLPELEEAEEMEEELLSLDRVFYEAYGGHMKYLRPPKGEYSERELAVSSSMGYVNVFWSFAYDDWYTDKQRGADYALQKVTENLHNGCVILLHAVSQDNADALGDIIDKAREAGYEFRSLDEYE